MAKASAEKEPLEVKLVAPTPQKSRHHGKFPYWNEEVPKRKVKFSYLQQPGTNIEFSKGRTIIKNDGNTGTHYEKYDLMDGKEYDLPVDVIKHLNSLVYQDKGQARPRCMCAEV